ncbi:hypothetical protein HF086_004082 [Spodoptera exigua]|uniref:Uncharacterized protein n=1 Tax=Spodoptera exigua TaxID=7107 RepID=A0A922MB68_SPOEX|nr:hypothetical protein HF086_004082 [Spodoptera exigua]
MKTYVFLITFGFIQLVFCSHDINITDYESVSVCPIKFFRRKRAFTEYTRWRASQETTNEFLVKVLDEDLTTAAQTQQIVAVNIQPVTKGGERIIIGGAKVPPTTTTQTTTDAIKDYTRFIPAMSPVLIRVGDHFIAPIIRPNQPLPLLYENGL